MDNLPVEVVLAISSYLDKPSVSNFRLTGKCFAKICAESLDIKIRVDPRRNEVPEIVKYQHLQRAVRSLVYVAPRLNQECKSYEFWKGAIAASLSADDIVSDDEMRVSYERFIRLLQNQTAFQGNGQDIKMLSDAFHTFPNLKEVVISSDHESFPELRPIFENFPPHAFEAIDLGRPLEALYQGAAKAIEESSTDQAPAKLKSLRIELDWTFLNREIPKISRCMDRITRFGVVLNPTCSTVDFPNEDCFKRLGFLLESLPLLRTVNILNRMSSFSDHWPLIRVLKGNNIWHNLEAIGLGGFRAPENNLLEFFGIHSKLRSIQLCNFYLDGSWVSFLTDLRRLLPLKTGGLSIQLWDQDGGEERLIWCSPRGDLTQKVQAWIEKSNDVMPLTRTYIDGLTPDSFGSL